MSEPNPSPPRHRTGPETVDVPPTPQTSPIPATSGPSVGASEPPHRRPGDDEVVYFDGRPLLRADQAKAMLWFIVGLALIALPIAAYFLNWGWPWPWWVVVACVLIGLAVIVIPWLRIRAMRYRITNYRIDYERGLLTKRIDTLELWHVDDIQFEQGLVDRMMNVGTITVVSDDRSTPRLVLHGVPKPREIFDALKQRVIAVKRQRGVIKMDTGG